MNRVEEMRVFLRGGEDDRNPNVHYPPSDSRKLDILVLLVADVVDLLRHREGFLPYRPPGSFH